MSLFRNLLRLADSYSSRGHRVEMLGNRYLRVCDAVKGNVYFVNVFGGVQYTVPESAERLTVTIFRTIRKDNARRRPMPSRGRRVNRKEGRQS